MEKKVKGTWVCHWEWCGWINAVCYLLNIESLTHRFVISHDGMNRKQNSNSVFLWGVGHGRECEDEFV